MRLVIQKAVGELMEVGLFVLDSKHIDVVHVNWANRDEYISVRRVIKLTLSLWKLYNSLGFSIHSFMLTDSVLASPM